MTQPYPAFLATALRLAALAGLALLADPLTGLVDTAAAARLGVHAQASLALGAGIATATGWLISPILFALTTEVGQLRARGAHAEARAAVGAMLRLAAGWGALLAVALVVLGHLALDDPDARSYLLARAVGLPLLAVTLAGYGALRGAAGLRDVTLLALGGVAVHAGVVALAVTATGLGVTGIGLAAAISQATLTAATAWRLRVHDLWPRRADRDAPTDSRGSAAAVGSLVARALLLGAGTTSMTAAAVSVSPAAGAAHLVVNQAWLVAVLAVEGWKSAAQIMVATTPVPAARRRVEQHLLGTATGLGLLAAAALAVVPSLVVPALAADPDVAAGARRIWWLAALALGIGAVAFTRDGIEFGQRRYLPNVARTALGTAVTLLGSVATWLTGELAWMWAALGTGLLLRAALPSAGGRRGDRTPDHLVVSEGLYR